MNVFIILSGGPGVYDSLDPELHDKTWDNFVTPPLLRFKGTPLNNTETEEVHWLVYEPAYEERWKNDRANKSTLPTQYDHTESVKGKGYQDYLALLKDRAKTKGWTYKGLSSGQGFWDHINGLKDKKVSRVWFYGHARDDLWLSLDHLSDTHDACAPSSTAIIKGDDIKKLKLTAFVKSEKSPSKFSGCNTAKFAKTWATTLQVYAEGTEGKVDFANIHSTGGFVELSSGAKWIQYSSSGAAKILSSKAKDKVG